jgi:hypothetical protein
MKKLLFILLAGLLTGCATNPFAQFYQDYTTQWPVAVQQRLLPPSGEPQIQDISGENAEQIAATQQRLLEQGFAGIGFAGFSGGLAGHEQLLEQAKKIGADVVLCGASFSHSEQGAIPWMSYQQGQTYTTTGSGVLMGNNGNVNYFGSSTTTSPGTYQTQLIPYQRQVFIQGATFWRRIKLGILGVGFAPIPDELRMKLQRNTGALITLVRDDSPAFKANLMRGDVVIQIADKPVVSIQDANDLLSAYAGQKVQITVIRDTQTLVFEVQLNQKS